MDERNVGGRQHKLIFQNRGTGNITGICDSCVYSSNEALRKSGESLFTRLFK